MPPIPSNVVHPQALPDEPAGEPESSTVTDAIDPESEAAGAVAATTSESAAPAVDLGSPEAASAGDPHEPGLKEQRANASDAATKPRHRPAKRREPAEQRQGGLADSLGPLAIFAAVAAGSWLLWQVLRRRRGKPAVPTTHASSAPALTGRLTQLPAAPPQPPPAAPQPLAGRTFAIADK